MSPLYFVLLFVFFSGYSLSVSTTPRDLNVIFETETVKLLEEGCEYVFDCPVPSTKNVVITIVKTYKNKSYDVSTDLLKQFQDRNVSTTYDKSTKTYTFKIENVVRSDIGTYSCRLIDLSTGEGECTKVVTLTRQDVKVLSPAEITALTISANSVHEGNPVTLECYASGYPEPIVYWKMEDNSKINSVGVSKYPKNVLKIIPATKKDAGIYQCVAENSVGPAVIKNIRLNVFARKIFPTEKYEITESIYEDEE